MPRKSSAVRVLAPRAALACLAVACLALAGPVAAKSKAAKPARAPLAAPAPPPAAIADKQADLQELRGRIETLRRDLAASEEHQSEAADRLRESERQISSLQRDLYTLGTQRSALQNTLQDLGRQSTELEAKLGQQQAQLEKLVYRQYLQGNPDSLQLLLNGTDPNQMARDLHYLAAIAHARRDMLGEIRATLAKKKALSADAKEHADELAAVEAEQKQRHAELSQQHEERRALLAQISEKVKSQRKEIGNLQENEKRLSQLIDRLGKLLAAQAAEAARAKAAEAAKAKAAEAAQAAQAAKNRQKAQTAANEEQSPKSREKTTEPTRPKTVEAVENRQVPEESGGQFAKLRGSLRLPSRGVIAGRFGAAREGGGTWKGLFIRAGSGNDVKAVAGGRVVFAEWMRGFGNLLIIDHGDAYLSIYGNNESLLKQVGERVKGGETVATVGNSGGNPESGLYFELRHQGQPIDPMKWASLK